MLHWQRADDDGEQAVVAGLRVNGHHGQPPPRPAATIILLPPPQQEPKQEQQEPNQHLQQLWRAATAVHSSVGQPAPQPPPSALQTDPQASIAAIKAAPSLAALEAACAAVPASSARQPGVVLAAASRLEALVRTHTAHVQDWRDAQRWPQHQEQPQQEHQQQHHHQHERQHRQRQLAGSPPRGGGAHRLASAAKPHIRSVLACLCQWTVEAHSITAGEQQPALAPHPHPDTRPHTKRRRQWHRRHASGAAPPTPAQARRVLWPHQAATILHALARAARVAGPGCVSTAAVQQLAACLTAEDGPVEKGGTPLMPAQVVTAAWSLAVLGPHHLLQPQQRPPQQAPSSSSASEPPSPSPSPGGLLASVLQWLYRGTQPHLGEYSGAQTARLLWALGTLVDASPPGSGGGRAHDWAPGHPSQPRPGGAWWRALEAGMLSCPCAAAPGTQLNGWACGCLPGDVLPRPLSRLEAWTLAELALCCWGAGLLADAPHTTQALDRQGRPGAQQPGEGHPSPLWVEGLERAVWAALRRTRRAQHQQGAQLITGLQRLWACALQPPSRPATAAAAGHEAPHPHQSALLAAIVQATAPGAAVARLSSSSGGGSSTTVHARSGSGGWPAALAAPAPVRVLVPSGGGGAGARPPGTLPQPHLPLPQGHGQPWVDAETAPLLLHVNGGAAPTLSDLEPLLRHQLVAAGGPAGTQLQAAPPTERSALQRPLPPPAPPAGSGAAWAHGRAAASAAAGAQLQARGGALPLTQLVQVVRSCRRLGTPLPPATLHTLSHSLEVSRWGPEWALVQHA